MQPLLNAIIRFVKELLSQEPLTSQIRQLLAGNKDRDQTQWTYYGSDIGKYEEEFKSLLPCTSIESFISQKTSPVILDIMSPPNALRSLFKGLRQEDRLGVAVSLSDLRSARRKKADTDLGIHQIAGNVMMPSTWNRIGAKLKNRKADLIMERGGLGLIYIPDSLRFYAIMANKMWDILSPDNGMLLLQIRYNDAIGPWVDYLNNRNITVHFCYGVSMYPLLRIDKNPNSPSKLPFL